MRALAGILVAGIALALPAGAAAHAQLEETEPARGAALERAPGAVEFRFNEPVEAGFGSVAVYDRDGERVDSGELTHPDGRSDTVAVGLEAGLRDGVYTATYRVLSADSHPVSGGFTFTVGDPGAAPALGVDELIDEAGAGPVTEAALGAARVVTYASTAIVIGGVIFLVFAWAPALGRVAGGGERWRRAAQGFGDRLRPMLLAAVVAGALATALGIVLQGAVGLGGGFWDALRPAVVEEVLNTRFGAVWGLRLVDLGLLAVLLFAPAIGLRYRVLVPARLGAAGSAPADPLPSNPVAVVALGVGLSFLALAPALAGHAGVTDPEWALVSANFVHVLAFAVWAGGLAALLVAVPAATRALDGGEKAALLAGALSRFSTLALAAVAALLATGVIQALFQLEAVADLVESGYGRAIVAKAALLVVLIGLGASNRSRSLPAVQRLAAEGAAPGTAGVVLRRAIRAEVALIGGVLAATAFLAATAPPATTAAGPVATSSEIGSANLELTVDPAIAGANEVHLYFFDRQTGAQYDEPKEVRVAATLPAEDVGPLPQEVRKAGPGHYVIRDAQLGIAGEWTLDVSARVSAFDQYSTEVEVPIR